MYPDSGYKRAHAQSVCTRPFSRVRVGRGLGTRLVITMVTKRPCNTLILHKVQSNVQRTTALFRHILIDIQTHST